MTYHGSGLIHLEFTIFTINNQNTKPKEFFKYNFHKNVATLTF